MPKYMFCADDIVIRTHWNALPDELLKIEEESGFAGKVRIAREDPALMFPGGRPSLLSQRHAVAPLIPATRPCEITC
jgi:hypothetical protein